jgi:hypothetical protein
MYSYHLPSAVNALSVNEKVGCFTYKRFRHRYLEELILLEDGHLSKSYTELQLLPHREHTPHYRD